MSSFPTTLYKVKDKINIFVIVDNEDELNKLKDYFCDNYDGSRTLEQMNKLKALELIDESAEEIKQDDVDIQKKIEEEKEAELRLIEKEEELERIRLEEESNKETIPDKEEVENSISELHKELKKSYMSLDWNQLRTYAKELEKSLDVEIIKHGSTKESIQLKIKEVLNGDSKGSDN